MHRNSHHHMIYDTYIPIHILHFAETDSGFRKPPGPVSTPRLSLIGCIGSVYFSCQRSHVQTTIAHYFDSIQLMSSSLNVDQTETVQ